jgi:hypothetical protein
MYKIIIKLTVLPLILMSCDFITGNKDSFKIAITASPLEGGKVSPQNGTYSSGELVTILATPESGWRFVRWEGEWGSTQNPSYITVYKNYSIIGVFEKIAPNDVFRIDFDGTTLEQITNQTGTPTNITYIEDRKKIAGKAAYFNGINSSLVTGILLSNVVNNFTIMAWVKPEQQDQIYPESNTGNIFTPPKQVVIAHSHGQSWDNLSVGVGLFVATNVIHLFEHAHNHQPAVISKPVNLDGWNHITVVYRNKTPYLYLNGRLVHTGKNSVYANLRPSSGSDIVYKQAGLGRSPQNNFFRGAIDDLRIINISLSDQQVLDYYESSK